jgi:hypothetical protein
MLFCVSATTACYPDNPVSVFFQPVVEFFGCSFAMLRPCSAALFVISNEKIAGIGPAEFILLVFLLVLQSSQRINQPDTILSVSVLS